jgi:SpoVK/Ycf46/Vps4 family AAA+-type ATPase
VPGELAEMIPIVDYALPTQSELMDLYDSVRAGDITESQRERTRHFTAEDAQACCSAGAGMTRLEFQTALCMAYVAQERRDLRSFKDFKSYIMDRKVSVVKRSEVLEVLPSVSMDEVGGLENLKEWIEKRAGCYTEEARAAGVDLPNGVALIGPPGTGKSLGAKAIGSVLGIPVIKFDVSRVFGSLVGESEARMAKALQMIDAMAPCVCLVDEVDKVFDINSGGGDSGTSTRVLGKILTHMQESKAPIFWVLTANRTRGLPPEMLRKGRLDELFSVTTPMEDERRAIFEIHLKKRGFRPDRLTALDRAIEASSGYVGGEIEAAVKEAAIEAFHTQTPLTADHLVAALGQMKPLSRSFKDAFEEMEQWAEHHARPSSAVRKAAAASGRMRTRSRPRVVTSGQSNSDDDMAG